MRGGGGGGRGGAVRIGYGDVAAQKAANADAPKVANLRGRIASAVEIAVRDRDGDDALERVFSLVDKLLSDTDRPILGIGIGTAGLIDTTVGTVL